MVDASWIGRRIRQYRLDRVLAEGGMGVVFQAHDEHLNRPVAVKFLALERAGDKALKRFRKEALSLSRLNHPSIATVHDYDEHEGVPFLVLEFVPGRSLSALLRERGPLPPEEVRSFAMQLASALEAAHAHGIVHRDLKPSNVVLDAQGRAKLLDFGVAQWALQDEDSARLRDITKITETVGTLPYMAPEQLIGVAEERSDLFSIGVVFYELVTGKRPFEGSDASAVMNAIRLERPHSIPSLEDKAPAWLAGIILRCLQKAPEDRFASAAALLAALEAREAPGRKRSNGAAVRFGAFVVLTLIAAWALRSNFVGTTPSEASVTKEVSVRSLAVLPLRNATTDESLEYLADGLTASLIGELGRLGALHVISRTSTARYAGTSLSLPEIAAELQVDAILEGSVTAEGDRLQITAELRHGRDERRLWGTTLEGQIERILELQRELVRELAEGARIELTGAERGRLQGLGSIHPEAWRQVQRGRYFWEQRVPNAFERSIECFEKAIELDPSAAMAHAELSRPYCILALWGVLAPNDAIPVAQAAARRALELDDSEPWAHVAVAWTAFIYDWDLAAAEESFERAIELQPSNATAHEWYALMLATSGRGADAIEHMRTALSLDEFSSVMVTLMGTILSMAGEVERGIEQLELAARRYPTFPLAHSELGYGYLRAGRYEDARRAFQRRRDIARDSAVDSAWAYAVAMAGEHELARGALAEWTAARERGEGGYVSPTLLAFVHAALGESDRAFEWLSVAEEERDTWLMLMHGRAGPELLAGDARFDALLKRIGMPKR